MKKMGSTFKGGDNLCTVEDVRLDSGLTYNTDVKDNVIETYREKARGDVWTYVSGRYDLKSFTEERFIGSLSFSLLRGCQMLLASAYLMQQGYGSQRIQEEEGSKTKYDQQMAILDDIRKGNTRLLDSNNDEFDLLPKSPNQTPPKNQSSSFGDLPPREFRTTDMR